MDPPNGATATPFLSALELPPPMAALVALSRRGGAAAFPFDSFSDFGERAFQAEFHSLAQRHEVLGLVLIALERAGRLSELGRAEGDYGRLVGFLRRQAAVWDLERDFVVGRDSPCPSSCSSACGPP